MKKELAFSSIFFLLILSTCLISSEELNQSSVTEQEAIFAINESENLIYKMRQDNLPVEYLSDTLLEAKRVYEQAKYAEILRGEVSANNYEKLEAKNALSLVDWNKTSYSDVLVYTEEITQVREKTFLLADEITLEESKITSQTSEETIQILNEAKTEFSQGRFNSTENLIEEFRIALERENVELSTLSALKNGAKNFFQRYWIHILIFLVIFLLASYFLYKKIKKRLLENKIKKLKTEQQVLANLMRRAQDERFKRKKISGLVYNIRMEKYKEREQEIQQELPVLEARKNSTKSKPSKS